MENPRSWGKVRHAIADALTEVARQREQGVCGLSDISIIYNFLNKSGYISEDVPLTDEEWLIWREQLNK